MQARPSQIPPPPAPRAAETLVPDTIPFITDRGRAVVRDEYMPAADHKALALSSGPIGLSTGQADDDTAKAAALDMCQKRADASSLQRKCELYAVGDTVVYARGRPPMPPTPWVTHDPSVERPVVPADFPLMRDAGKANCRARTICPAILRRHWRLGRWAASTSWRTSNRMTKRRAACSSFAPTMPACPACWRR